MERAFILFFCACVSYCNYFANNFYNFFPLMLHAVNNEERRNFVILGLLKLCERSFALCA